MASGATARPRSASTALKRCPMSCAWCARPSSARGAAPRCKTSSSGRRMHTAAPALEGGWCIAAAPDPEQLEARARCAPCDAHTVCSRRRAARLQGPFPLRLPHRKMPGRGEFKRRSLPRGDAAQGARPWGCGRKLLFPFLLPVCPFLGRPSRQRRPSLRFAAMAPGLFRSPGDVRVVQPPIPRPDR